MRRSHLALAEERDPDDDRVPAHPFLKWAGGKWSIAPRIERLLPHDVRDRVYREPFVGGGAMFFYLQPHRAILSDSLRDLIDTYRVVQLHVDALISRLEKLRDTHTTEQFYAIRAAFNEEKDAPRVERAARLIYLNKTCFNGLFRTNREGAFNVPVGRFKNPGILDATTLRLAAAALADAELVHDTFEHLLDRAEPGDVIYLDPPYVPLTKTASFCAYADGAFTIRDQTRLAEVFRELDDRGCLLALSNSDTPEVRRLYAGYDFSPIIAPRAISSKASTRGEVTELLIRNVTKYPAPGAGTSGKLGSAILPARSRGR
ncbi:MAG: DNA adenine methylase [Minicystis sp.]